MKKMKKLLSVLLASAMTLAMAAPTFADDPAPTTYTITINNENPGHTYEAYQIFSGRLEEKDGEKILSDIVWGDGVTEAGKTALGNAAEKAETITDETVKSFAQEVGAYLGTVAGTSEAGKDADDKFNGVYTISGLEPGYYLVKDQNGSMTGEDDAYTQFILRVVANATAEPKPVEGTDIPDFEKKVGEGDGSNGADYNIRDNVPFQLNATLPTAITEYNTYKLVFTDTVSAGLDFNSDSVKLLVDDNVIYDAGKDDLAFPEGVLNINGRVMTVTIDNAKALAGAEGGKVVSVQYTAKLNGNANLGTTGENNKANLEYSNNPNNGGEGTGKTTDTEVKVYTFGLELTKVRTYDPENPPATKETLAGAVFTLKNSDGKFAVVDNGKVARWADTEAEASKLTSGDNGLVNVNGLDAGTYTLTEETAPVGYNKLAKPIVFTITSTINEETGALTDMTATYGEEGAANPASATVDANKAVVSFEVMNNTGATLPSTGGIGTTIFYAAGIILMAGAVFFVVRRKRA